LGDGDLQACFMDVGVRIFANEVACEVELRCEYIEALLVFEPVAIAAIVPLREVFGDEGFGGSAELSDDDGVWKAVAEHAVDAVAEPGRKAGDFACAAVGAGGDGG